MSSNPLPASRRHSRQRSSVSVKKRTSLTNLDHDIQDNSLSSNLEPPDNTLSPSLHSHNSRPSSFQARKTNNLSSPSEEHEDLFAAEMRQTKQQQISDVQSSYQAPSQDYFTLGSPYPEKHQGDGGRMESMYKDDDTPEEEGPGHLSRDSAMESVTNDHDNPVGETTTRTELDLFEEEEEEVEGQGKSETGSQKAPAVPPKENDQEWRRPSLASQRSDSVQSDTSPSRLRTLRYNTMTPARNHSSSSETPTPTSSRGNKRLSLLAGNITGPSTTFSPTLSPISTRFATTPTANVNTDGSTPVRKIQRGKRMSLSYIPSPVASKTNFATNNGSLYCDSTTPSAVGTPPTSSSANANYFSRLNGSNSYPPSSAPPTSNGFPDVGLPTTPSAIGSSPTNTRSAKKEDGDTVMTQHKDLLSRIAEKERKIFELREGLAREEDELRQLQKQWQRSVHQELAVDGTTKQASSVVDSQASSALPASSSSISAEEASNNQESLSRMVGNREANDTPINVVAAEGWKAFSAKLSGAGIQLNAFIDQLAAPPPEEERTPEGAKRIASAGIGLDILQEEAEEHDPSQESKEVLPPLPPSKGPSTSTNTSRQAKRSSMFGSSLTALQKQVEMQFGAIEKGPIDSKGQQPESGGWGSWQKRLNQARENATGLLAKAEAKLGQALTIDELMNIDGKDPSTSNKTTNRPVNGATASNLMDFSDENDREKAALAELSWLNSLAGINMSGTTDRVTTSKSPVLGGKKPLSSQNLGQLDNTLKRTASNSSRASRRASNTSHSTTNTTATTNWPISPSLGATSTGPSYEDSSNKRDSNGFFSLLSSAAWGPEKVVDDARKSGAAIDQNTTRSSDSKHRRQSSNGQSKTRTAVKMALQDRDDNGSIKVKNARANHLLPAQDKGSNKLDIEEEDSWGW